MRRRAPRPPRRRREGERRRFGGARGIHDPRTTRRGVGVRREILDERVERAGGGRSVGIEKKQQVTPRLPSEEIAYGSEPEVLARAVEARERERGEVAFVEVAGAIVQDEHFH